MGAAIVFTLVLIAVFAPVFAPTGYAEASLEDNYATPSLEYPLGADFLGRDMLSRLIYGARVSLSVGIVGATLATILRSGVRVDFGLLRRQVGQLDDASRGRLIRPADGTRHHSDNGLLPVRYPLGGLFQPIDGRG